MTDQILQQSTQGDALAKNAADHGDHGAPSSTRIDNLKFGMWLFLASEVILFTIVIVTFIIYRITNPAVVKEVHEATGVLLVTVNTFLLLSSSWAMVMGLREIQRGNRAGLIRWIGLTAVLGLLFVGLQGVEYGELAAEGITIYSNEFGMRFYAPTALHGLHVVVGVLWALAVIVHAVRGGYSEDNYVGVEVFGLYWHFVDVVWIFLFTVIYLI